MRIAILGASLDGLLMAHLLSERGHNIELFGEFDKNREPVRYTEGVAALLPEPTTKESVFVAEVVDKACVARPHLNYHTVSSFEVRRHLDLERFETSRRIPEFSLREWDRIVTTLPPNEFFGAGEAPALGVTWCLASPSMPGFDSDLYTEVFSRSKDTWYQKAVYRGGQWYIFSLKQSSVHAVGRKDRIYASRIKMPEYNPVVIPVGKYAEWDESINVFDHVDEYVDKIEQGVTRR